MLAPVKDLTVRARDFLDGDHKLVIKAYDRDGQADATSTVLFSTSNWSDLATSSQLQMSAGDTITVYGYGASSKKVSAGTTVKLLNLGPSLGPVRVLLSSLLPAGATVTAMRTELVDKNGKNLVAYAKEDVRIDLVNGYIEVASVASSSQLVIPVTISYISQQAPVNGSSFKNDGSGPAWLKSRFLGLKG